MPDPLPPLIVASALTTLLLETLEQPELGQLVGDELTADLRELAGRLEMELRAASRSHLRLAEPPED
jgi:hypothetical protein